MSDRGGSIKCVVWDLDNTVWDGILLEGDDVRVTDGVAEALRTLDARGILLSIASRNDPGTANAKLAELGLDELFIHPQITWGPKSDAVATIARLLNIGTDAIAFVDDDPFERDEVAAHVPGVLCIDARDIGSMVLMPELNPRLVTEDSRRRRSMMKAEIARSEAEQGLAPSDFLSGLDMVMTIAEASNDDLDRVEELTLRTNQLNSTGNTYSYDELDALRLSPSHRLVVAGLDDRYGPYGKIGLALVEDHHDYWLIRLLLVSCRVMGRGVAPVLLSYILEEGKRAGKMVRAEFIRTDRNRPMYLMFKLAGFREIERRGDIALLAHDLTAIPPYPAYVELRATATT